ncbi:MAG: NDP-sugar synthase [Phycisphaerae bacterium]|nr:NDP-sugar synthase [Phycisphaerae bacterium]
MLAAIILAGAHVWDADSLDALCPRLLWPIGNTPLATHQFRWLAEVGIHNVVVCANSDTYLYQRCFGDGQSNGLQLAYYVDRSPRGPAGCCHDAAEIVSAEQYVVLEGTVLPGVDLLSLLAAQVKSKAAATVLVNRTRGAFSANGLQDGTPAGVYVFSRRAFEFVRRAGFQDIKEMLIPRLREAGEAVNAYPVDSAARVSDLESYLAVQGWALQKYSHSDWLPQEYAWRDGLLVHRTARVDERVRVVGPVMVGPHSRIEESAIVVGPTVIGRGCTVRAGGVVGRSVFWARCRVGPQANLDRCLLTTGASVAANGCLYGAVCRAHGTG